LSENHHTDFYGGTQELFSSFQRVISDWLATRVTQEAGHTFLDKKMIAIISRMPHERTIIVQAYGRCAATACLWWLVIYKNFPYDVSIARWRGGGMTSKSIGKAPLSGGRSWVA
jgi:hypothetical protein